MTVVCLTGLPLHLWRVLVSKDAMSDHEVLAVEVPGGVILQTLENQQIPALRSCGVMEWQSSLHAPLLPVSKEGCSN